MNMNKKSPALPQSKETEKGKEKTEKIRKEKKDLEEKLKQLTEKYEKIKKLNTDLTKEAISLNEEKFEVKVFYLKDFFLKNIKECDFNNERKLAISKKHNFKFRRQKQKSRKWYNCSSARKSKFIIK